METKYIKEELKLKIEYNLNIINLRKKEDNDMKGANRCKFFELIGREKALNDVLRFLNE